MPEPSENLSALGLTLPAATKPVASYVPAKRHGDLVILSGQIPLVDGEVQFRGQVGDNMSFEDGVKAAEICALNAIAVAADAVGGVDRLAGVLKVVVYVAVARNFSDVHRVANGASELLTKVFGDAGQHARAAVGVATLPLNAAVEVDVTFIAST